MGEGAKKELLNGRYISDLFLIMSGAVLKAQPAIESQRSS